MKTELSNGRQDRDTEETCIARNLSTPTNRRKRHYCNKVAKVQPEAFVIKLFDRSLDLSDFTNPLCSLYPICRLWISNKNNNQLKKLASVRENNGAELLQKLKNGDSEIIRTSQLNAEVPGISLNQLNKTADLRALDEALKTNLLEAEDNKSCILAEEAARGKLLADYKNQWKGSRKRFRQPYGISSKAFEIKQLIQKKYSNPC